MSFITGMLFWLEVLLFVVFIIGVFYIMVLSVGLKQTVKQRDSELHKRIYGWSLSDKMKYFKENKNFFNDANDEYGDLKKYQHNVMRFVGFLLLLIVLNFFLVVVAAYFLGDLK